jgi:hypothetical protein
MPRPPLPIGTSGRVRTYRTASGSRARTTYRTTMASPVRSSSTVRPRRRVATALRDRAHAGGGPDLTPEAPLSTLAEAWYIDAESRSSGGSPEDR